MKIENKGFLCMTYSFSMLFLKFSLFFLIGKLNLF